METIAFNARLEERDGWRPDAVDPVDAGVLVVHAAPRVALTADAGPEPVATAPLLTDAPWWCE